MSAVNDAYIVEHLSYQLVEKYATAEQRTPALELLRRTMWLTCLGQHIDGKYCYNARNFISETTQPSEETLIKEMQSRLTTEHFMEICKMKTSYYTIVNPTKLGLILAGVTLTDEQMKLLEDICISIGVLFQAKDDYLDVYGDPKLFEKIGMDVEDGKCTWIVTTLLNHAATLEKTDPQTSKRIKLTVAVCIFHFLLSHLSGRPIME